MDVPTAFTPNTTAAPPTALMRGSTLRNALKHTATMRRAILGAGGHVLALSNSAAGRAARSEREERKRTARRLDNIEVLQSLVFG